MKIVSKAKIIREMNRVCLVIDFDDIQQQRMKMLTNMKNPESIEIIIFDSGEDVILGIPVSYSIERIKKGV